MFNHIINDLGGKKTFEWKNWQGCDHHEGSNGLFLIIRDLAFQESSI